MPSGSISNAAPAASRVTRYIDSPFVGFAPWIALSLLEGPGRLTLSASVALVMAFAFVVADRLRGKSVKLLGIVDVVSFVVFLVLAMSFSKPSQRWLETWFGEVANAILVVAVVGSLLARMPFTLQYAREEVEEQFWDDPLFIRINYVVTAAWAIAFLIAAITAFIGDAVVRNNSNLWTSWALQFGIFLVAFQFDDWYPRWATAVSLQQEGSPADTPPPPIEELMLGLAAYFTPLGVISLIVDGGPEWLGITMIVGGGVLAGGLRRRMADRTPQTASAAA